MSSSQVLILHKQYFLLSSYYDMFPQLTQLKFVKLIIPVLIIILIYYLACLEVNKLRGIQTRIQSCKLTVEFMLKQPMRHFIASIPQVI